MGSVGHWTRCEITSLWLSDRDAVVNKAPFILKVDCFLSSSGNAVLSVSLTLPYTATPVKKIK